MRVIVIMSPSCCEGRPTSEDDVLKVLSQHEGEIISVKTLADELNLDPEELRIAVIRLRNRSRVKLVFGRDTGNLVIGEPKLVAGPREASAVCAYCGDLLPPAAHFCPNCGSSVIQQREED